MELTEFEKQVKEMRQAQKEFFRTKKSEWLEHSKDLEKKVDQYLTDKESNQITMF